ncbi:hypothetical protein NPIL_533931 [Nephila pilipes]|uniref:Uncharacterized protein n=1 Tax=Nephila pilipes TaxID=299642 RepID=A0A8X6TVH4_NEPPI|nr:hypothetical protein NPIL_533931 [Nephila pilipes]
MSETHSEKRNLKVPLNLCNKKSKKRSFKNDGKFNEDCIPDGIFPIGMIFCLGKAPIMIPYQYISKTFQEVLKTYHPTLRE